jgi:outer membrane lipoprotein-sorting protein
MPRDDAPRPEHADHLREQVLARFDQARHADSASSWWKRALIEGRIIMRRPIPRLIAASVVGVAIFAAWLAMPARQSAAHAFNRIAETLVTAKTARFQMEVSIEGQPKQKFKAWFLAPHKIRQEVGNVVNIGDFETGKIITLMPDQKRAMVMNMKGAPKHKSSDNYFDQLRRLLMEKRDGQDQQYERLGEKEFDGKKAAGFRFDAPIATITLWGDPKTGDPIRIETVWSGIPRTEVVMTDFQINVELKASLFDQTVPADYKAQSIDVDASEPREQDLVAGFKACAEISGGEFPESLDTIGVQKLIIKYAMKAADKKDVTDEKIQELMSESIRIGRGFQFVMQLPESAEATYAGKGAKRDEKARPIFWYKPDGGKKYRVIFADLTVQDADSAPQVAGAKRIEKASKTHKTSEK